MYVGGQKDLQLLDQYTIEQFGLPGIVLMENAGNAVVQEIVKMFSSEKNKIVVLAGAGNNGGDGFVIARRLYDLGYNVLLCLAVERTRLKGDALLHFNVYVRRELPLFEMTTYHAIEQLKHELQQVDVIVDALLGTGVSGAVKEPFASMISMVNEMNVYVVAVDIPSGLSADTGRVEGVAVQANQTVTFAMPKKGFFLQDGPRYIGEWRVVDISVSPNIVERLSLQLPKVMTEEDVEAAIPKRIPHGHKGTFGHGLVIGGSKWYVGAPIYSAKAAFRTGIGLVTLAIPNCIYETATMQSPESLFMPLIDEDGHIAANALSHLDVSAFKAIAIGPGLSRFDGGESLLADLFEKCMNQTIVVDADGLFYLKNILQMARGYEGNLIITPHPGEMAMLTGMSVKEVEENRLEVAIQFAKQWDVYVLLKGHRSIIVTPFGDSWINPLGNDALGKGGSGDVLTGVLLSFLAQGATSEQALIVASYLHAKAGEKKGHELSNYGVTPIDVIDGIRKLLK